MQVHHHTMDKPVVRTQLLHGCTVSKLQQLHRLRTHRSPARAVNVHAAQALGTEGEQQQCRARTEGMSSKVQELTEMRGDAM